MTNLYAAPETYVDKNSDLAVGNFFSEMFSSVTQATICESVLEFFKSRTFLLGDFPVSGGSYSRSLLAQHQNGYEAMIARWNEGAVTQVHGHPDYALYILLIGCLGVEDFISTGDGPQYVKKTVMKPGDYFCMQGTPGKMDNGIHRITALQESLSVHVYSDDALKGVCFSDYKVASPFVTDKKGAIKQGCLS